MTFDLLGLRPELLSALATAGFTSPTPIQEKAIPVVLSGRDVLAAAQTGTGKTAGFTLPLLQRLMERPTTAHPRRRPIRALILTPTRELAAQVGESVETYGAGLPLRATVIFGGVKMGPQLAVRGLDIDQLPFVVNFELPHVPEDYVHRIGRTGRAGSPGEAIALVSDDEKADLLAIEKLLGKKIARREAAGFIAPSRPAPVPQPQSQSSRQPRPKQVVSAPGERRSHGGYRRGR